MIPPTPPTAHRVNRETSNPAHSPYLHFGRVLKQGLGRALLSRWNPSEHPEAAADARF